MRDTKRNRDGQAEQLVAEGLVALAEATQFYPRNARGKHPHVSQLHRHATQGLRGVVLETVQAGSKRATSRAAIARFFARLTEAAQGAEAGKHASATTATACNHPAVEAHLEAELARAGF
jgi:hypothetical protein